MNTTALVGAAYWAGVGAVGCAAWGGVLPGWAMQLVGWAAARGKPTAGRASHRGWTLPHGWFWHFYALGSACTLLLLLAPRHTRRPRLLGWMLLAHSLRRLGESVWLASLRSTARMSAPAYVFGLSFYVMAPLTVALVDDTAADRGVSPPWLGDALRTVGIAVFLYGSYHQHVCHRYTSPPPLAFANPNPSRQVARMALCVHSCALALPDRYTLAIRALSYTPRPSSYAHRTLGRLRASKANEENTARYGIPAGGWFDSISCAHYTAEVVLYAGLACTAAAACPPVEPVGALPWLLLLAVTGNLGYSARATHAWYLQHLPRYPRHRWAFIPYVC